MKPLTQSKNTSILPVLIALTLVCFALSPQARAVCQEGCDTFHNAFLGDDALISNNNGVFNTAIGFFALNQNTNGLNNTAIGAFALGANTTSSWNTATGTSALNANTGEANTANGGTALSLNTTGSFNTASGMAALHDNTTGSENTASGVSALYNNTTGSNNIAMGHFALFSNISGDSNIAVGESAGFNLTTGSTNIYIGNPGDDSAESRTIRIGTEGTHTATYIAGIRDVPIAGHKVVGVDANGKLGTKTSSARFKEAIKPMGKASEAILSLQPVSFRYKKALDPKGTPEFGLIAEEVAKVAPELVDADSQGKPFSVRYDEVNAMLLNEFLKARRQIDAQQKQIEALTAGLQKVSAQLQLSKPAPQVTEND